MVTWNNSVLFSHNKQEYTLALPGKTEHVSMKVSGRNYLVFDIEYLSDIPPPISSVLHYKEPTNVDIPLKKC